MDLIPAYLVVLGKGHNMRYFNLFVCYPTLLYDFQFLHLGTFLLCYILTCSVMFFANYSRRQLKCLAASVCLSVSLSICLHVNSKKNDPLDLGISYKCYGFGQGHRVTKCKNILKAVEWPP